MVNLEELFNKAKEDFEIDRDLKEDFISKLEESNLKEAVSKLEKEISKELKEEFSFSTELFKKLFDTFLIYKGLKDEKILEDLIRKNEILRRYEVEVYPNEEGYIAFSKKEKVYFTDKIESRKFEQLNIIRDEINKIFEELKKIKEEAKKEIEGIIKNSFIPVTYVFEVFSLEGIPLYELVLGREEGEKVVHCLNYISNGVIDKKLDKLELYSKDKGLIGKMLTKKFNFEVSIGMEEGRYLIRIENNERVKKLENDEKAKKCLRLILSKGLLTLIGKNDEVRYNANIYLVVSCKIDRVKYKKRRLIKLFSEKCCYIRNRYFNGYKWNNF